MDTHISEFSRDLGVGERAFLVKARANEIRAQGHDVIELEIGEPDFTTPRNVREAIKSAIDAGMTHYEIVPGNKRFREVIAAYVGRTRKIDVSPDEILVTGGAKSAIFYSLLTVVKPGGFVMMPDPTYPVYKSVVQGIGALAAKIPLKEENNFRLDIPEFRSMFNTKSGFLSSVLIFCSPQNPTGGIFAKADLEVIAEEAKEREIIVIADEIYSRLLYGVEHESIMSIPGAAERTVMIDGFSKTYAMTGLRLGYAVVKDKEIYNAMKKIAGNDQSCVSACLQQGGIEALTGPQDAVDEMRSEFEKRKRVIVAGLNTIPGIHCNDPVGAFYVFPNVQGLMEKKGFEKADQLADALLETAYVAGLSGTAFGSYGEGHMRFSYANSIENIEKAVERIRKFGAM
jgi:aspartate/methionine/tyrosine aminotransferase